MLDVQKKSSYHIKIFIVLYDPPWNKACRIEDLGVRIYSGQVGRRLGFPVELYLSYDYNYTKFVTGFHGW